MKQKTRTHQRIGPTSGPRWVYVDEFGKVWNGRTCYSCAREKFRQRCHERGIYNPIDKTTYHPKRVGRESEHTARKFFEKMGFSVKMTTAMGPDLILEKNGFQTKVEVKTASKHRTKWVLGTTRQSGRDSDYIAIVHEGHVFVQPMKYHLSQCSKDGKRTITKLIRSYINRYVPPPSGKPIPSTV